MLPANAAGELQLGTKRPQMLSVTDFSSFYPISAPKRSWAGCSCTLQHPWHLTAATTALGGHPPRLLSVEVAALSHRSHLGHPARAEQGFSRLRSTKKQLPGLIPRAYFQTHCIRQAFGHAARERARWPLGVTGTPVPPQQCHLPRGEQGGATCQKPHNPKPTDPKGAVPAPPGVSPRTNDFSPISLGKGFQN